MDMGIRGWMIVIGVLLVLAVLLDGYRRMKKDRRGTVKLSLKMGGGFEKDTLNELPNSELPGGGARVVERNQSIAFDSDGPEELGSAAGSRLYDTDLPSMSASECDRGSAPMAGERQQSALRQSHRKKPASADARISSPAKSGKPSKEPVGEELVLIKVMSKDDGGFVGEDLLHILLACDLRFGKMNIFHRYEFENGKGPIQFSVANILEPGSFDLDNIKSFSSPGIVFFLSLPGPENPAKAFEYMLETAQCLVKNLNGEIRDCDHRVMTQQTLAHCRQRIRDHERRSLMQHA